MKAYLLIGDRVYPIQYENDTELFEMKGKLLAEFEAYLQRERDFMKTCREEEERFRNDFQKVKNGVMPENNLQTINYPKNPNSWYVEFCGNKISSTIFKELVEPTSFGKGVTTKIAKLDIQFIPEDKLWDTMAKIRKYIPYSKENPRP